MASHERAWLAQYSPTQIQTFVGSSGSVIYNILGIPLDRFRLLVAQDVRAERSMTHLARTTLASPSAAFVGGSARISMKILQTTTNLYIPSEWRKEYPFLSNFLLGVGLSPLFNIPRVLQLGKVSGATYPNTFRSFFMSFRGWGSYLHNTAIFGPGEGLRMMTCFGMKDWLLPQLDKDPTLVTNALVHTARMSAIAGPLVALVETTVAVTTESISTIQAHVKTLESEGKQKQSFGQVLKEAFTLKYSARCWSSLFLKNAVNNSVLFWFMFTTDFYVKAAQRRLSSDGR